MSRASRRALGKMAAMRCLDGPTFVDTEGWDWIHVDSGCDTGYLAAGDGAGEPEE